MLCTSSSLVAFGPAPPSPPKFTNGDMKDMSTVLDFILAKYLPT